MRRSVKAHERGSAKDKSIFALPRSCAFTLHYFFRVETISPAFISLPSGAVL
jgi:hypothetical protein